MGQTNSIYDCAVQILIYIDENIARVDKLTAKGIYLIDNQLGTKNAHPALPITSDYVTTVARKDKIYWQVFLVDPNSKGSVEITSIGNCKAWGFNGQPEKAYDSLTAYSGRAEEPGNYIYNISINLITNDGNGMTLDFGHSLNVLDS
ncbi:hypothetical protein KKJ17_14505 [Xenorhabdus bovienii]|uniref:Inclusion body protein n=1 Tax=Xenorhabdus bovienii TaxID=40576 RepID=A0AAJ1JDR7_XENBV|nr:hypothetical protein [Xenorhabdus bovienii]MDE1480646.1 hypothetical protein [Xenorhabdus bovienii]MDE1491756.1 hypothetical protein [Xenorhabdus bovienii]MDE9512361.1 hypothetical protein [Xenorhabdus bovienii]MDE9518905.1 hypothetical protein [Xenorhabdus bovienii]MDE9524000.1 hypothetical protein [Xenorhabdus bovienii]